PWEGIRHGCVSCLCSEVGFSDRNEDIRTVLHAPLEPRDAAHEVLLHPPMVGEELSRRISPRSRVSRGPDVVLAAYASAPFPLVVPEVQVLVSVDSTHPEATPDPHGTALVLPLFRGRSPDP